MSPDRLERDMVGSYELLHPLGEGGMARLYLGRHTGDGHEAAIKILHDEMAEDESLRKRFVNEARAIASIDHPSVVKLYEFGQTHDGNIYLAMEYIEGGTLEDRLKVTPDLPVPLALSLADQIAGALGAAHGRGITHRDLKPSNIMLLEDGGEVRAKLLDFGIAKFLDRTTFDSNLTKTGIIVGTPKYMAPEQCTGADDIDHRADIYSLGVILFRMLTGRVPFSGRGPAEVIALHMHGTPKSLRVYKPSLSVELDALVMLCLAKEPGERFQTVGDLRDALHREMSRQAGGVGWDEVSEESTFDVAPTSVAQPAMRAALGLQSPDSLIPTAPVAKVTATQPALPGRQTVAGRPSALRSRPGYGSDRIRVTPATPDHGSDRITPATPGYGADRIRVTRPTPGRGIARAASPGFPEARSSSNFAGLEATQRSTPAQPVLSVRAPSELPPEELDVSSDSQKFALDTFDRSVRAAVEPTAPGAESRRGVLVVLLVFALATFALVSWQERHVLAFVDDARAVVESYLPGGDAETHDNDGHDGQGSSVTTEPGVAVSDGREPGEPGDGPATRADQGGASTSSVVAEPVVAEPVVAEPVVAEPAVDPEESPGSAKAEALAQPDNDVEQASRSNRDQVDKGTERVRNRRSRKIRRKKRARSRSKNPSTSVDRGSRQAKPAAPRARPARNDDEAPVF